LDGWQSSTHTVIVCHFERLVKWNSEINSDKGFFAAKVELTKCAHSINFKKQNPAEGSAGLMMWFIFYLEISFAK
jgi:hypothetical protein